MSLPRLTSPNTGKQYVIRILHIPRSRDSQKEELKSPIGIMPAQVHRWVQYEEVCSTYHLMVHQQ